MTINFPDSPALNDTFVTTNITYTWNGSVWVPNELDSGYTGSQGPAGFVGSITIGFSGSRGNTGVTGFTGSLGFTGSTGYQGSRGFIGSQGSSFTGSQGIAGVVGFTGSQRSSSITSINTLSGTSQTLDIGQYNIFDSAVTDNTTLTFSNVPTSARWTLSAKVDINTNITQASYDSKSFSVSSNDPTPIEIFIAPDGTKMYLLGESNKNVHQYTILTAWDLSTASYDSVSFSVNSQESTPQGMTFRDDGSRMYISGRGSSAVYQYTLSTAWDLSTASYDSVSFSVSSQDTEPNDIEFDDTGTRMFILGNSSNRVYSYTLGTAWDLSTASYDSVSFSINEESIPGGFSFLKDGTRMYILGFGSDQIFQYTLGTAWDISTTSYDSLSLNVSSQGTIPTGLYMRSDGTRVYMLDAATDAIYQYSISFPTITLPASVDNFSSIEINTINSFQNKDRINLEFVTDNSGTNVKCLDINKT